MYHPHLPQVRLTTLNTSYHSTIRSLARRSVSPRSTPSSTQTHARPGNSGGGAYEVASFTPGDLHLDVHPSPSYAQAASGSGSGSEGKSKAGKPPSPQLVASMAAPSVKKGPPSLPGAKRRFFAPRHSPSPHRDALTIAAIFPDIAARILRKSKCLRPLGFSATVNPRGSISLTVTDKATPAASYAPYLVSLTRALNQSFPVGENP